MKILIIDDNRYVVEGLMQQLDWNAYGIDEVFPCYSVPDAKRILSDHMVDFVISDIEMPGQNGFDLLEWIRQRGSETEVVLLTSYTDFRYAQRAVGYKVLRYLLKPLDTVELENVVQEMVQQHLIREKKKHLIEYGNQWITQQSNAKAVFWKNLLGEMIPDSKGHQSSFNPVDSVPYFPTDKLVIVLIYLNTGAETWPDEMLQFLCSNTLGELSEEMRQSFEFVHCVQACQFVAIFRAGENEFPIVEQLMQKFSDFIRAYFLFDITYQVFEPSNMAQLRDRLHTIGRICGDNAVQNANRLIEAQEHVVNEPGYQPPDTTAWKRMIQMRDMLHFRESLEDYFKTQKQVCGDFSSDFLGALLVDWNLLVSELLRESATKQTISQLRGNQFACWLTQDDRELEKLMLQEANQLSQKIYTDDVQPLVTQIKAYIQAHIDDVSRSQIAEHFYLSPGYLSKLFHRETGDSLIDYIQKERIALAKKLLLYSDDSISDISIQTGYTNFSHFSKQFRRFVGCTPNEYRKRKRPIRQKGDNCD